MKSKVPIKRKEFQDVKGKHADKDTSIRYEFLLRELTPNPSKSQREINNRRKVGKAAVQPCRPKNG